MKKERKRKREKRSEAGRRFFWEVGDVDDGRWGEVTGLGGPKGASVMSGNTYYTGYMQRIMQSEYKVALSRRDCMEYRRNGKVNIRTSGE